MGAFLAGFYARRVRRILPALAVCLLLTSLFTVWLVPEVIRLSTGREQQTDRRITQDLHFASVLAHRLVRIPWPQLPRPQPLRSV